MSTLKAFGTVAIMVACFAVIYPRFMHPLVLRALGMNDPPQKDMSNENVFPPGFKPMPPDTRKTQQGADDIRKHIRPGPHPGMRAAAEMQRQQAQQGSSRGMMGVVLPMYAIGIVLYLVYTLFKVFNKSKNNSWSKIGDQYGGGDNSMDRMGFPTDFDGSCDVSNFLHDNKQRKELEDLLSRVDEKNVSTEEMRILQKRLEETEAQMTRILQAMKSVQTNVDRMTGPESFPSTQVEKDNVNNDLTEETGDNGNRDWDAQEEEASNDKEEQNLDGHFTKSGQNRLIKNVDLDSIDKDSDDEESIDQAASNEDEETGDNVDSNDDEETGDNVDSNDDEGTGDKVDFNDNEETVDSVDSNEEVETNEVHKVKSSTEQDNDSIVRHRRKQ
ncbi:unnamed protein product [Lymnaea stagnalis]|uniref:Resistance to inhibitors of cholinesterase protein 3 N-terminal domain-containing protein n=1 Tax=Lymnaea stagnalis TaxID=6523 RepID=A0AAV2HPD3_LYMST